MLTLTTNVSRYRLEQQMQNAENFDQWKLAALKHDNVSGFERWKSKEASSSYDYQSIRERLDTIKRLRKEKDDIGLLFALNEGIHGNQAGIGNPELYNRAKFGTKQLIENYVDEIVAALLHISNLPENDDITREDKIDFFERASHCFGRSALMLSGAGSIGYFHLGVIKTLFKHQILPTVISGSSAGAIFAAILGTLNDDALHEFFSGDRIYDPLRSTNAAKSKGVTREQVDAAMLTAMLENLIPDMTFQEAYEKTGRMISITIAPVEEHQTSRLMNAITSPNVFIRSAVMASCAVPGIFPSVMLMAKNVYGEKQPYLPNRRWIDGAVTDDLPAKRLARLYGVNHYIVSQANPLALAIIKSEEKLPLPESAKNIIRYSSHELLKSGEEFSRRYLRSIPDVSKMVKMFYSVLAQDYKGDINIVPNFTFVSPDKLLGQLKEKEIKGLVLAGEKATWPQLEQIKTCSKVGKALEQVMDHHKDHDVQRFYKLKKPNNGSAVKSR